MEQQTLREKAIMEWWVEYAKGHDGHYSLVATHLPERLYSKHLSFKEIEYLYLKEHPQDTKEEVSVNDMAAYSLEKLASEKLSVSVEDAAEKFLPEAGCELNNSEASYWQQGWSTGFEKGASWQKEQTKLLEDSHKGLSVDEDPFLNKWIDRFNVIKEEHQRHFTVMNDSETYLSEQMIKNTAEMISDYKQQKEQSKPKYSKEEWHFISEAILSFKNLAEVKLQMNEIQPLEKIEYELKADLSKTLIEKIKNNQDI